MLAQLNPQQEIAVQHVEGPLLVLAGAGSGKTRVVTHRIAKLLDLGVLPSDILAVTFTNKAADEMRSRIRTLKNAQVLACTFHSLGARILRESISFLGYSNDFTIYDEEDSEKLLKGCLDQLQIAEDKGYMRTVRHAISTAKNDLVSPDEADKEFAEVYQLYQRKLRECNALDFDDLLYLTVKLLQEHSDVRSFYQKKWQFVLIDEYQDTNSAQYTIAKILVDEHKNIFAVGDPDQSIYSWRGAKYQNILNFEEDFPGAKVVTLDQNYRSTNIILKGANALIQHNGDRYDKKLWSALGEGAKIGVYVAQNEKQEAEFVANRIVKDGLDYQLNEMAIFYRTNAQSRNFEDALLSRGIAYQIIGGLSFYQRREIKDILAYLKMIVSNADLISFLRTINQPRRGLGTSTIEKMVEAAAARNIPIFAFCEEAIDQFKLGPKQRDGLKSYVRTIHELRAKRPSLSLHELISEVVAATRYMAFLDEDPETAQDRKENVDELIGKAAEWEQEAENPSLTKFLEELSLRSNVEENNFAPSVKLMTLHNSKGLEFDVVFLVGLEEDLFPHVNTKDDPKAIEEERRLCYVGMTRAKRKLYLCSTTYRYMWGTARFMRPSRFLKEIPAQFLDNLSQPTLHLDAPAEEPPAGFAPGDQVIHKEFGVGTVQKAYEGSFGMTYEVHFPDAGTNRTLVAKYAKLQAYPN
ncbi:MAG: UvrD-helicase domain-containing protein [Parachlamydiales bacterium]|nr:UvrD-helicase domain-containing protein [Parachlamydiales bacterium]